jgi:DnaJ family protein A protein 2
MQTRMPDDSDEQNGLYTLLGIEEGATHEEIRKAYRVKGISLFFVAERLSVALRWHPDKVEVSLRGEAEEMFKSIKQAYDVLSDGMRCLTTQVLMF